MEWGWRCLEPLRGGVNKIKNGLGKVGFCPPMLCIRPLGTPVCAVWVKSECESSLIGICVM